MFTGIVEGVGTVRGVIEGPGSTRLEIAADPSLLTDVALGDSVSVAGVCLTVVARDVDAFTVDVVPETLRRTRLGALEPGDTINLERALRLGDRLGGHIVLGHVDGVAAVAERRNDGDGIWLVVDAPTHLSRFLPEKAFVTLDGVSLTVAAGADRAGRFAVALIPETLRRTTLGHAPEGSLLDLEVDPMARYMDTLLAARMEQAGSEPRTEKEMHA